MEGVPILLARRDPSDRKTASVRLLAQGFLAEGFGCALIGCAIVVLSIGAVGAQGLPPPPGPPPAQASPSYQVQQHRNPMCVRLEGQLAALNQGQGDGRAEQIQRYEEAANRQQQELDRLNAQARRTGCGGRGFFLFGGGEPAQCDQINSQIQRMRANLDRILTGLRQLQVGGSDREEQRRAIMVALAQHGCGPQYRSAERPRSFFGSLFGGPTLSTPEATPTPQQSSTYRTLCVRTCDGFFFPISFSTVPERFQEDERTCQRMCPAAEAVLFTYRNPGEDVAQAVSIHGQPYTSLPNAFRYRQEFNAACTCKRQGETWAEAVGQDQTLRQGDVVVTEDRAKALSQPRAGQPPPARQDRNNRGRTGAATNGQPQTARAPRETPADPPPAGGAGQPQAPNNAGAASTPPRAVGPQFYR